MNDFAFERLPEFVKSSRDKVARSVSSVVYGLLIHGFQELRELAKQEGKIFSGSTSSLTGMLSQVYFLISGLRLPDTTLLSLPFNNLVRIPHDPPRLACSPHGVRSLETSQLVSACQPLSF